MRARDETKERFLAAIAGRIDPGSVAEAHFFQPIRQGGTESGVAVIAVKERASPSSPTGSDAAAENKLSENSLSENGARVASRLAIYTAKYRLTLKGPDRGKWDFSIHAEADAPLVTVDKVVQGVQRRSGDAEGPERYDGDEFRALITPATP